MMNKVKFISQLGGKSKFKQLLTDIEDTSAKVYLDGAVQTQYRTKLLNGFFNYRDAARFVSDELCKLYEYSSIWYGQDDTRDPYYLLNQESRDKGADIFSSKAEKMGVYGISYKDNGSILSSDFNERKTVTRGKSRAAQVEKLKDAIRPHLANMCPDCQERFEKNPLRLLDCKVPECNEVLNSEEIQNVITSEYICDECSEHFNKVKEYLDALNIKYSVNRLLVRGLDYYNRTVFEIKSNNLGSQNAVCGGGRYDSLVRHLGGVDTPAVGFAMGMERLNSLLPDVEDNKLDIFVVSSSSTEAFKVVNELRAAGLSTDFDLACKKFGKQIEKASKVASRAVIVCEDEIVNNTVSIKDFSTSEQKTVSRNDFINCLK